MRIESIILEEKVTVDFDSKFQKLFSFNLVDEQPLTIHAKLQYSKLRYRNWKDRMVFFELLR